MAFQTEWGGAPNNNNGFFGYTNAYVYTPGLPFPNGSLDLAGLSRVYVESVGIDYASGGSGVSARILKDGVRAGSGWWSSGGTCQLELFHSSGTTYFGRNTAAGNTVYLSADGTTWAGTLCGYINWSTVPTAPQNLGVSRTGRDVRVTYTSPASNGGNALNDYLVQYSKDGGAWTGNASDLNGDYTYIGLAPGTYKFRVIARNDRGSSQAVTSGNVIVPAGGKRFDGTSFNDTDIAKRFDGSNFIDLSTAKRLDVSTWVDLG